MTAFCIGDPSGNRTRVTAVRGRCPRPLDDGTRKTLDLIIYILLTCKRFFIIFVLIFPILGG